MENEKLVLLNENAVLEVGLLISSRAGGVLSAILLRRVAEWQILLSGTLPKVMRTCGRSQCWMSGQRSDVAWLPGVWLGGKAAYIGACACVDVHDRQGRR